MSRNVRLYNENDDFQADYWGEKYKEPWLSRTLETDKVKYNKREYEKLLETPLAFKIISGGTIYWKSSGYSTTIEYKKNNDTWHEITSSPYGTPIDVNDGDILQFRGDNATYSSGFDTGTSAYHYSTFSGSTAIFEIEGNIMSLISSTGFVTATTLEGSYTFCCLFGSCPGLTNAGRLILPATTLIEGCYYSMFFYCTGLTAAPALPATALAESCYSEMFWICQSLTASPELPATTLASNCYHHMFHGCDSLTTAPETLPATTLAEACYQGMFYQCSSLKTAPNLPATSCTKDCYLGMFDYCGSLINPPVISARTLAESCCMYMFRDCGSLTTAPDLLSVTLAKSCYAAMFRNCRNLSYVKCLATDISANGCTTSWLYGASGSGTFARPASMAGTWTNGDSGIPYGWTQKDA